MKLYNTLSRQKENFSTLKPNQVGIYTCGPTVYTYPHIGNMRAYIFADTLNRHLRIKGLQTKHLINITDVGHLTSDADTGDDKIEKEAKAKGIEATEIVEKYTQAFFDDLEKLNIKRENYDFPRATDHIEEQIDLIKRLEEKGYTYLLSDGVYFDTSLYRNYSELGKLNLEELKTGRRIEATKDKKNPSDFALWKFSKPEESRLQEWPSPWGTGFPGWHIECSAMSMKYLGEHFDIHTGGTDHIAVHHTNERAQSECATGKTFANYWLHCAFLINADNNKMSKSSGNFTTLKDLEREGFSALDFRYLCLNTHYRKELKFSLESLEAAKTTRKRLQKTITTDGEGQVLEDFVQKFTEAMDDDLNTPSALAVIWEMIASSKKDEDKKATLLKLDNYLGLSLEKVEKIIIPPAVEIMVKEREEARQAGDWKKADEIRQKIAETGFVVEDSPEGPIVHK